MSEPSQADLLNRGFISRQRQASDTGTTNTLVAASTFPLSHREQSKKPDSISLTAGICAGCMELQQNLEFFKRDFTKTLSQIPGCQLCEQLSKGESGPIKLSLFEDQAPRGSDFRVLSYRVKSLTSDRRVYVVGFKGHPCLPSYNLDIRHGVPMAPTKNEMLDMIKGWLRTCVGHHKLCARSFDGITRSDTRLPTRVIDVGGPNTRHAHLVTPEPDQKGSYITLSHCWGQTRQVTTTSANIRRHSFELPMAELSKTFQDAIELTRNLGIRFLWIDSLCILQDDKGDWLRESQMMGQYYGEAYCTISATGGADGSQGLWLQKRNPGDWAVKVPISKTAPTAEHGQDSQFRYAIHTNEAASVIDVIQRLGNDPLAKRAWAFQERLLSKRIIHFASDRVHFECRVQTRREDGLIVDAKLPINSPDHIGYTKYSLFNEMPNWNANAQAGWHELLVFWKYFVSSYTRTELTYESDRLPALTGIANAISKKHCWTPACGLFFRPSEPHSLILLAWIADKGRGSPVYTPVKKREFPAWSWLGRPLDITYFEQTPFYSTANIKPHYDDPLFLDFVKRENGHDAVMVRSKLLSSQQLDIRPPWINPTRSRWSDIKSLRDRRRSRSPNPRADSPSVVKWFPDFDTQNDQGELHYLLLCSAAWAEFENTRHAKHVWPDQNCNFCAVLLFGLRHERKDGGFAFERLGVAHLWSVQDLFQSAEWLEIRLI